VCFFGGEFLHCGNEIKYSAKCEGVFWEKKKLQKLPYFEEKMSHVVIFTQ
jgi:hypothetical protein